MFARNSHRIIAQLRAGSFQNLLLLSMGMVDELVAGFFIVGLPLCREELRLTYEQIGLLFSIAAIAGVVVEPPLFLLSERGSRRVWIVGGLIGMAASYAFAAGLTSFVGLSIAFFCMYPSIGIAIGLSQATLMDRVSASQEGADSEIEGTRTMTRWTLMSSAGDLLSPLVVTLVLSLGFGWRGLCWSAMGCSLAAAVAMGFQKFPRSVAADDQEHRSFREVVSDVRIALKNLSLVRWIILTALCAMLDEVFLAFLILYLHESLHATAAQTGLIVGSGMVGGIIGLIVLDRMLSRVSPFRLLKYASLLALLGIGALLVVQQLWIAPFAFFVLALGDTCLYPISEAQAYAALPGRSALLRSITGLTQPFEILLPAVIGFVAGRYGLLASLAVLGTSPIFFLIFAPRNDVQRSFT